jgi:hypothetical protein
MHIDQANLVFETNKIKSSRYNFLCNNIFDLSHNRIGSFDIVFCLGLFYHISKHINMLEFIATVNTDILIIDTTLSGVSGSFLEIRRDPLEDPRSSCDYELVMFPTHRAVIDMVEQFGYAAVTLKPRGAVDYEIGARRAFICAKGSDLSFLANSDGVEAEVGCATPQPVSTKEHAPALTVRLLRRLGLLAEPKQERE